jgi:hypothetical protein
MAEQETVEINTSHILTMVNIMDACAKRGAFEGSELEGIGRFRGILSSYIQPPEDEVTEEETQ